MQSDVRLSDVPAVSVTDLHTRLGFPTPLDYPASSLHKPLTDWKMEIDDSPIFRYLYRNFRPRRHLEFGTWQGSGVLYCLEECDATVWTINLLEGETKPDGKWVYGMVLSAVSRLSQWVKKQVFRRKGGDKVLYQTDALGFIGRFYLEKGLGYRVCQIYADSRKWDISNYPDGFFDSVLVDGGHSREVVTNDTRKGLKLLRPGGMIIWHDFCPSDEVLAKCESPRGVLKSIAENRQLLRDELSDLFWVNPSWMLLGMKR